MAILYRLSHWLREYNHLILGIGLLLLFSISYFLGEFGFLKASVGVVLGLINMAYWLYLKKKSIHDTKESPSSKKNWE